MATGASINQRVAYGFSKAAGALGFPYSWYRPQPGKAALDPSGLMGSVVAYITTDASLKSSVPPSDSKPEWFGAYDTTLTNPGDYFLGALGTFFIAAEFLPAPPALIFCNEVVTLGQKSRPTPSPQARNGASSVVTVYAQSFPCYLKSAERRSTPELHSPGVVELPSADILLPQSIATQIQRGDVITTGDTNPQTWTVQSADLLFNCWNVVAEKAGS